MFQYELNSAKTLIKGENKYKTNNKIFYHNKTAHTFNIILACLYQKIPINDNL